MRALVIAGTFKIDLITSRTDGAYVVVLVEEGPWPEEARKRELVRLQARLNDVVDAALNGLVAAKVPEAKGCPMVIRLECYGVPRGLVEEFFRQFTSAVHGSTEVQADLAREDFVSKLDFEFTWQPSLDAS